MNNIFSSPTFILAHGGPRMSNTEGLSIAILMFVFIIAGLLRIKPFKIPMDLCISSIIPFILVTICIVDYCYKVLPSNGFINDFFTFTVIYPGFVIWEAIGLLFITAFIVDALIIFGVVRLIVFVKQKIADRK